MKQLKLDDLEKIKLPYQVSEDYFDRLQQDIQAKVVVPNTATHVPMWRWSLIPALLITLLAAVVFMLQNRNLTTAELDVLAQVSNEEIMAYLEFSDISEYDIAAMAGEPDLLLPEDPNYVDGINIEEENLDDLLRQFGLEEDYL